MGRYWALKSPSKPTYLVRCERTVTAGGSGPNMHQCVCKWWDSKKGFGFIIPNGGGDDIFCHVTAVQLAGYDNLLSSDVVSFDLAPGRNGKQMAANVQIISEARSA